MMVIYGNHIYLKENATFSIVDIRIVVTSLTLVNFTLYSVYGGFKANSDFKVRYFSFSIETVKYHHENMSV